MVRYLDHLRRRWPGIAVAVGVAIALALVAAWITPAQYTATARILIENKPDVLLVERGQFVDQFGGRFAYVVHGGIAEKQPIRIGATSIESVEILDGLKPGDQVVIAGSDTFADAPRVRINN